MAKRKVTQNSTVVKHNPLAVPPNHCFVEIYFNQQGRDTREMNAFLEFYDENGWTTPTGNRVTNWKAVANNWIWNCKQVSKQSHQKK